MFNFNLMFIPQSSFTRYLKTYGMTTFTIFIFSLQCLHSIPRALLTKPVVELTISLMFVVDNNEPHSLHIYASCLSETFNNLFLISYITSHAIEKLIHVILDCLSPFLQILYHLLFSFPSLADSLMNSLAQYYVLEIYH